MEYLAKIFLVLLSFIVISYVVVVHSLLRCIDDWERSVWAKVCVIAALIGFLATSALLFIILGVAWNQ